MISHFYVLGLIYDLEICLNVQTLMLYELTQKYVYHLQVSLIFSNCCTRNEEIKEFISHIPKIWLMQCTQIKQYYFSGIS